MRSVLPLLLTLLACGGGAPAPTASSGGGSTPSAATGFEYTDPVSTGWRLQRNAALSTPTHLVLELWAPAGEQGTGAGLVLAAEPAQCAWAKVASADADLLQNLAFSEPVLARSKAEGGELQAGAYRKGLASPATYGGALLRVALDYKAANLAPGSALKLEVSGARKVAADGTPAATTVAAGSLKAK